MIDTNAAVSDAASGLSDTVLTNTVVEAPEPEAPSSPEPVLL